MNNHKLPNFLFGTRGVARAALLAVGLLLIAACGEGDDDDTPSPTQPAADASPSVEAEATTPAEEDSVQIDESFWHAGWKVTLGEASFAESAVAIEAQFENLGENTAAFDSQLVLIAGGENYTESTLDQDLPQVPGGLKGAGVITFSVNDDFSFDDATLVIGNVMNNQATVPLGPGGDDYVSLEPQAIAVTGSVTAGALTLNVTGAELRADLPDRHSEVEKGHLALTVEFSATVGSGIVIGQGVLQSEAVALKLPDGTAVAVRSDGVSGVNELLQGKEGTTIPDLSVRFETNDPASGAYAFVLRGNYGPGGSMVEGELPFAIP